MATGLRADFLVVRRAAVLVVVLVDFLVQVDLVTLRVAFLVAVRRREVERLVAVRLAERRVAVVRLVRRFVRVGIRSGSCSDAAIGSVTGPGAWTPRNPQGKASVLVARVVLEPAG